MYLGGDGGSRGEGGWGQQKLSNSLGANVRCNRRSEQCRTKQSFSTEEIAEFAGHEIESAAWCPYVVIGCIVDDPRGTAVEPQEVELGGGRMYDGRDVAARHDALQAFPVVCVGVVAPVEVHHVALELFGVHGLQEAQLPLVLHVSGNVEQGVGAGARGGAGVVHCTYR